MQRLYHGTASVASAKVRLVLAEKALSFESHVLDLQRGDQHRPEYKAIHPGAMVPALVHDGHTITESTVIMEYLDDAFPSPALLPTDPYGRAVARLWLKEVDEHVHPATVTVTFALAFRRFLARKTPDELEAHLRALPDPDVREARRLAITHGLDEHARSAVRRLDALFARMEDALTGDFLAGGYSLADAAVTPYVLRAQMLGMAKLWTDRRPRVAAWLERVRARPSWDQAIERVMTDADRQRLTVDAGDTWPRVAALL
jgi:glutathione S-transferase